MKQYKKAIRINGKNSTSYMKSGLFWNENGTPHSVVDNTKFLKRKFSFCNFFCQKFKKKVPHILITFDDNVGEYFDEFFQKVLTMYPYAHIVDYEEIEQEKPKDKS